MSIILDALKKADSERHLGELPGLHTHAAQQPVAAHVAKRSHAPIGWYLAAGAAAVIVLGLLAWQAKGMLTTSAPLAATLQAPTKEAPTKEAPTKQAPDATQVPAIEKRAEPTPDAGPKDMPVPQMPATPSMAASAAAAPVVTAKELPVPPAAPKPVIVPKKQQGAHVVARSAPAAVAATPATAPGGSAQSRSAPAETAIRPVPAAAEPPYVMSLAELPANLQRELPPLAMSGTLYSSNPADRILLMDKRMLHEGDEVAPGLVLESVLPKGATLRYKGYRFRIAR